MCTCLSKINLNQDDKLYFHYVVICTNVSGSLEEFMPGEFRRTIQGKQGALGVVSNLCIDGKLRL